MNQPPLNPDALEAAYAAYAELTVEEWRTRQHSAWRERLIEDVNIAVSAYIAAALPEVASVEELVQLPVGTVILPLAYHSAVSVAVRDQYGTWAVAGHPSPYETEAVFLGLHGKPARVLHKP